MNGQALAAKQQTERAAARAVRVRQRSPAAGIESMWAPDASTPSQVFAAVKEPKANSNTLQYTTPNLNMPVTLTRLPNSRMRLKARTTSAPARADPSDFRPARPQLSRRLARCGGGQLEPALKVKERSPERQAEVPLSFCETAYNEVVEECKKELK